MVGHCLGGRPLLATGETVIVSSRHATRDDLQSLAGLYRALEQEMVALHTMWPQADGLDEPIDSSLESAISDDDVIVLMGSIDEYPFGFLIATVDPMLEQAQGEQIGAIRFIYVDQEAREVAIAEAMRDQVLAELRERGISKFDAHVLPGHRLAKNFFESGGFSARSIIMHHDDNRE